MLAELDELEQETLDEQMLNIGTTTELPSVPQTELPKHEKGFLICHFITTQRTLNVHIQVHVDGILATTVIYKTGTNYCNYGDLSKCCMEHE